MLDMSQWNVLIVDDEPDNIGVVAFIFDFHKVPLRTATSGKEALELLRQQIPSVLLLDVQMPVMSGWEVLKEIRNDPSMNGLVIIALTAHAMAGDREKALEAGFDGYMTKPISASTFINDIRAVIEARNLV